MSRISPAAVVTAVLAASLVTVLAVSCSKSAGNKEAPKNVASGPEVIAVPDRGMGAPGTGGPGGAEGAQVKGGPPVDETEFKLRPEEGQLSIVVPPDAKAGTETVARVVVTTTPKFKINFEYPTKLALASNPNVTIPKAELKAGGPSQVKGDADKFEEKELAFAVKLTPTASGSHTITGSFKFAVCDKDQCLPRRESIAIQVAAK